MRLEAAGPGEHCNSELRITRDHRADLADEARADWCILFKGPAEPERPTLATDVAVCFRDPRSAWRRFSPVRAMVRRG
jgi:hypothetical protein